MLIDLQTRSRINSDDIIIFKNGKWTNITKGEFLASVCDFVNEKEINLKKENEKLRKENEELRADLQQLKSNLSDFKVAVNEKLKQHHDVLNALTGAKK